MPASRDHYQVLGVRRDASHATIKAAHRARMRELHPDSTDRPVDHEEIAAVSAAWSVLSNARRRAAYDTDTGRRVEAPSQSSVAFRVDATPARYPWKFVLTLFVLGTAAVLVVAAFSKPTPPAKPDNVLQAGSCVNIAADRTVGEVSCATAHDATVKFLVAFDAVCPADTEPYLDRQGMGRACVIRVDPSVTTGAGVGSRG